MQSPCSFYAHVHNGETWEQIAEAVTVCRDQQRAEVLDIFPDELWTARRISSAEPMPTQA